MFHVKHVLGLALILVGSSSCGYQPVYSGSEPAERLAVVLAPSRVPNAEAVQAALAGARAELARSGSLRGGSGYPRLVLEITRVDDEGTGIQVVPAPGEPGDEIPLNRAGSVGVVARGWVEEQAGADPALDTGDMRRVARYASPSGASQDARARREALRAAGRALGRALARRVLGQPEPSQEAL